MRCLNIAKEIYDNDPQSTIHFLTDDLFTRSIIKDEFIFHATSPESYEKDFLLLVKDLSIDVLILDVRNDIDIIFLQQLPSNILIVTIDDPEKKVEGCDIALYPPVPQLKSRFTTSLSNTKILSGWQYIPVSKKFKSRLNNGVKKSKVLISCGSSDPYNYTGLLLNNCLSLLPDVKIDVVLGSNYVTNNGDYIKSKFKHKVDFYENVNNLEEYLSNSDFAIITHGQTAYESFCTGTASVLLPLSEDHYLSSLSLTNCGFGLSVNYPVDVTDLKNKILTLSKNIEEFYSRIIHSHEFEEIRNTKISEVIKTSYEEKGRS